VTTVCYVGLGRVPRLGQIFMYLKSSITQKSDNNLLNILCAHTHRYVHSASYCQPNCICTYVCIIPLSAGEEGGIDRSKDQPYAARVPQLNDMAAITLSVVFLLLSPLSP